MELQELGAVALETPDVKGLSTPECPALWRGIGTEWPCTRKWTLAGLAERLSGRKITARVTDNELDVFFEHDGDSGYEVVACDEYINSIIGITRGAGDRPAYAGSVSIKHDPVSSEWAGELLGECPLSDWFPGRPLDEHRIWIGAAGQKSTIHSDPYDNVNAQIIGKKEFIIFAPEQHPYLYPEFIHAQLWASRVDPDLADFERFPKLKSARGFRGQLSPGDVLFIPKFWWHAFSATEASLNINRWIYSEEESRQYWHEQPAARRLIDYRELLGSLVTRYESLSAKNKDRHRKIFEELKLGMLRLAEESETATGVTGGTQS